MNPTTTPALGQPAPSEAETVVPVWEMNEDDVAIVQATLTGTAKEREADVLGWYRVLPRLIAEGEEGRFALIFEGKLVSVWDTHADAIQAGYDKFGVDAKIFASSITQKEIDKLKRFLVQERAKRCRS